MSSAQLLWALNLMEAIIYKEDPKRDELLKLWDLVHILSLTYS